MFHFTTAAQSASGQTSEETAHSSINDSVVWSKLHLPPRTSALQASGRLVLAYGLAHHYSQGSVFTPVCPIAWPAVRCALLNCQLHCLFDSWFPAHPQDFNQTSLNSVQCRLTRSAIYDRATPMMYPIRLCSFNSALFRTNPLHCTAWLVKTYQIFIWRIKIMPRCLHWKCKHNFISLANKMYFGRLMIAEAAAGLGQTKCMSCSQSRIH